jgi:hypothetical protein
MAEFPTLDLRDGTTGIDLREEGAPRDGDAFEFRLVKQRFAETFLRLDIVGRPRSWYLDNLLLEIASAGPEHAVDVGRRAGYRFLAGPVFVPAPRGRVEVSGRMAPVEVVAIPEPSGPVGPS